MDDEARQALAKMEMPRRSINFVPAKSGEILKLGHIICRIMEDGSRTGTLQALQVVERDPFLQTKYTTLIYPQITALAALNSPCPQAQQDLLLIGMRCTMRPSL